MLDFFREGGFPMLFILAIGLAALSAAVRFAVRPKEHGVALVRALAAATGFASLAGFAAALAAVGHGISGNDAWAHSPELPVLALLGLAEALANAILGFVLVALAWLGVAVGVARLGAANG